MNDLLVWLLGQLDFGPAAPPPVPVPPPVPAPLDPSLRAQVLSRINAARRSAGLFNLTFEPRLQAAALSHALVMSRADQLGHFGIGDGDPWERITLTGYRYATASENVAWGQISAASLVSAWLNSPGHRTNLLGPYRDCGIAVARRPGGRNYWCMTLANPAPTGVA